MQGLPLPIVFWTKMNTKKKKARVLKTAHVLEMLETFFKN